MKKEELKQQLKTLLKEKKLRLKVNEISYLEDVSFLYEEIEDIKFILKNFNWVSIEKVKNYTTCSQIYDICVELEEEFKEDFAKYENNKYNLSKLIDEYMQNYYKSL